MYLVAVAKPPASRTIAIDCSIQMEFGWYLPLRPLDHLFCEPAEKRTTTMLSVGRINCLHRNLHTVNMIVIQGGLLTNRQCDGNPPEQILPSGRGDKLRGDRATTTLCQNDRELIPSRINQRQKINRSSIDHHAKPTDPAITLNSGRGRQGCQNNPC